jgi:ATP phosphoribosyltransferase regulatory subunit
MHDMLPGEIAIQDQAENEVLKLFRSWAYQKVATPTLEYGACIQPNEEQEDAFFKFFDRQGHVLVLRPELTTPISRMVSTRMRGGELPLRICYAADVFRYTKAQRQEFRQAGVELIGSASSVADAEVIALAVESLRCLGLKDFQLNLGHMGIFTGLMDELEVPEEFKLQFQDALARKDFVGIERLVGDSILSSRVKEILLKIPHLHGTETMLDEVLKWSAKPALISAVEALRQVYRYLQEYQVQDYVSLDLGILRGFSYYTGVIFEGYVPGVGFPIVEGGRYDALYEEFGYPQPATGFAMNIGALIGQLPAGNVQTADALVYGENIPAVIEETRRLRLEGVLVEMCLEASTQKDAEDLAHRKGIESVVYAK